MTQAVYKFATIANQSKKKKSNTIALGKFLSNVLVQSKFIAAQRTLFA